jgi:hypothetical protein
VVGVHFAAHFSQPFLLLTTFTWLAFILAFISLVFASILALISASIFSSLVAFA